MQALPPFLSMICDEFTSPFYTRNNPPLPCHYKSRKMAAKVVHSRVIDSEVKTTRKFKMQMALRKTKVSILDNARCDQICCI